MTASYGDVRDGDTARPYGDRPLSAFTRRAGVGVDAVLANPGNFLQGAGSYIAYDLDSWVTSALPIRAVTVTPKSSRGTDVAAERWLAACA